MKARVFSGMVLGFGLFAAAVSAQTPSPGAKAIGMGGTFVATGDDATSLWGNPAGLGPCPLGCGVIFAGAVGTDVNEFARTLRDDFSDLDLGNITDPEEIARIADDLAKLQVKGTGTIGSGNAGLAYAFRGWALGIGGTAYTGAYPVFQTIDVGGVTLPTPASRVVFKGLEARELRLGYAGTFSGVTLGGDIRYIKGYTYFAQVSLSDAAGDPEEIFRDALKKNERQTNKFSADIGATYTFAGKVRVGIVGLNLNEPEFGVADGSTIALPRTYRMGAAFAPISFDGIVFSADADLNHQKTLVPGLDSRRIAAGAQIFFLQVGTFRDLDAVDPHWAFTAGLHLGLKVISIGISGAYSSDKRDIGAAAEVRVKL